MPARFMPRRHRTRLTIERLESRELLAVDLGLIAEYSVPTQASAPADVALGPDGALWVTESAGNKIARYDPNLGKFTEYAVPTANAVPYSIASGGPADPSLYFTEYGGGKLGRIATTGTITEAPVTDANGTPIANSPLRDLAYDPLGSSFYTSQGNAKQVGLFQAGDFFQYVPFQPGQFRPTASAPDSDNWGVAFDRSLQSTAIYFTESDAGKIAVYETSTRAGFVTHEYPLAAGSKPLFIVQGPDGGFWFTESGTDKIGRIDATTRAITEYALPTPDSKPWGIAASANTIYFTESAGNKIGRITFANNKPTITEIALPNGGTPQGITIGDHGQVWFTEESGNRLGLYYGDATVTPPYIFSAAVTVPAAGFEPLGLTGTPDGNLYFYAYNNQSNTDGLGRIPTGNPQNVAFFPYSSPGGGLIGYGNVGGWIATGGDGSIWSGTQGLTSTFYTPQTVVIDPGTLPSYKFVHIFPTSSPSLTLGPDFVTMFGTDATMNCSTCGTVDRYDPAAGVTQFSSLPPNAATFLLTTNITVGARGELWAAGTNSLGNQSEIFRFNSDFSMAATFPVPGHSFNTGGNFNYIAFASDGNVWFTDRVNNRVGRITPDGALTFVSIPVDQSFGMVPYSLVSAPDGNLYFLELSRNNLVRIDPRTMLVTTTMVPAPISIPPGPSPPSYPVNTLAVGPDGNLWLSTQDGILRYSLPKSGEPPPGPAPTVGSYLADTYGRLTGAPLANDRLRAITRRAFGSHSKVTPETTLESLPASRRNLLLRRIGKVIFSTPEYRRAELDRISATSLYHPADRKLLGAQGPIRALRVGLLSSASYKAARAGGQIGALVSAYYHDLLHRTPTSSEARFWTHLLKRGVGVRNVVARIANSPEGLAATVQTEYSRLLGRSATSDEVVAQVKNLRRTKSTNGLILSLVTSQEFQGLG